ncbi:MAG: glycosyltransferase [Flavobacteriales bacterium]|nr:glycosyltransferase [Flavobacteriales bacterium]
MKLLVLLSRVPYPLEKGDKLRAYHLVERLARSHEVHLFCLSDTAVDPGHLDHLRQICEHIEVVRIPRWRILLKLLTAPFTRLPFQVAYFHHKLAQRRLDLTLEQLRPDHVLCQLVRTTEYVRRHPYQAKTLDYMDTLSKGMERRTENAPFYLRPVLRMETRRLIHYENLVFDLFDQRVIISEQDRDYLYHPDRGTVTVVPNGVDTRYFSPRKQDAEHDLVFTGNMNYPPNIDSVLYLAEQVLPIVWSKRPSTSLLVSGVDPAPVVRDLARKDPRIKVTGWVKDIRTSYASARLFVAPMQIGTGLQNKLLEAMAMGIPCITSELANNAVGAPPGRSILIGQDPDTYAEHILGLLDDAAERHRLSGNGLAFVRERFSWESATAALERAMTQAGAGPAGVLGP